METLEYITVLCPYCGESNEVTIERTDEEQSYNEDCQVCCCSMQLDVTGLGDEMDVTIRREDE
ncbi:MAG: CPXCG motif-containing cysteine-rich protein [Mariprofundaceae bacterium]